MENSNLFDLLGLTSADGYSEESLDRAWYRLRVAAENSGSSVHQEIQNAYNYLRSDPPESRSLLRAIYGHEILDNEPSNLLLQRTLVELADQQQPISTRDAETASLLINHAAYSGFVVWVHENNPYSHVVTTGQCPHPDYVPVDQSGPPLKNGMPRESGSNDIGYSAPVGPSSLTDHLYETLIDVLSFRWIKTTYFDWRQVIPLAVKVCLLGAIGWYIWNAWEQWVARSDVWEDRWVSDEIYDGTNNAEDVLRVVRGRFRDIQRQGTEILGWNRWWEEEPPTAVADSVNTGPEAVRDLFIEIQLQSEDIQQRIETLTPNLDSLASSARATKSRDGIYAANRVWDDSVQVMKDLDELRLLLDRYATLRERNAE